MWRVMVSPEESGQGRKGEKWKLSTVSKHMVWEGVSKTNMQIVGVGGTLIQALVEIRNDSREGSSYLSCAF